MLYTFFIPLLLLITVVGTLLPSPTSGRLILLFLLVMTLLLHNYYTSIIVSTLLMGGPPSFTTIAELTSSSLEIGMEDAPYVRTLFAVSIYILCVQKQSASRLALLPVQFYQV